MSGFKPGSTLAPPAGAMTPDNKPAAPGLAEALAAMLHYFDSPKRDDWLDETNWRSACSACQMAHAALEAYKRALISHPVPSAPEPSEAALLQATIQLNFALRAMLTYFGMDEDEWSKPTFDQARAAVVNARPFTERARVEVKNG